MSEQVVEIPDAVHILGIGGAGMSALARLLLARGVTVTGSDAKDSRRLQALRALGAQCYVGHDAAHVGEVGQDRQSLVAAAACARHPGEGRGQASDEPDWLPALAE